MQKSCSSFKILIFTSENRKHFIFIFVVAVFELPRIFMYETGAYNDRVLIIKDQFSILLKLIIIIMKERPCKINKNKQILTFFSHYGKKLLHKMIFNFKNLFLVQKNLLCDIENGLDIESLVTAYRLSLEMRRKNNAWLHSIGSECSI